jgi:nitrite reductase/ring-hydroxylating ferredoxin subunit
MTSVTKVFSDWRTRANAPQPGTLLARVDELPADNNGLEVSFGTGEFAFRVVLFRVGDAVRAYVNECPHFQIPFNFQPDVFCVYDIDGRRDLMCAHHTAMFHLDDGACYDGPCAGDHLCRVEVVVAGDEIRIA